ncbi:TIR domain-containing protein [Nonlabens dokdonensis]|jgi:hypothetical protein|uniref:WD-40 repeat protein n=2 Tax=Nonlabens dokdonensis TaxID=328515 RepID=L7WDB9_NONDD|nr:toll/interleukin-1 receptor domain-containing protein [Nonlabens dokdonensis]AGC78247.1 WD-40 repeat protein [Nonlabens dokdonensis DSW-6]PZX37864.1 TIR domain-containing protein [Nonlabens dokdonensis]
MKKLNIYIDNYGGDSNDKDFATKLKERFLSVFKEEVLIKTYSDLEGSIQHWEKKTVEAIAKADIVIPIISPIYLEYVPPSVENALDEIIDSKKRYLFPIYLEQSEFGSFNWIIKSKLIPSEIIPISDYSKADSDKVIINLMKTIKNIILNLNTTPKKENVNQEQQTNKKDKILFISHDHDDSDFAELLKLRLEKKGLAGWIDSERLKIGQDWREEIDQGIENSIAVIAVMTPEARKSEYVTYEWAFAWGKGKKIFPILLKQTPLHPRLESLQYLDFTNKAARPWAELITSIENLIK